MTVEPRRMPTRPPRHPILIAPTYLAELRGRVEAIGVVEVARVAAISRQTAWRALAGGGGRRPNPDAIERIRRALLKIQPDQPAPPPPVVVVRGAAHHAWIALADRLTPAELTAAAAAPARVLAAVKLRRRK